VIAQFALTVTSTEQLPPGLQPAAITPDVLEHPIKAVPNATKTDFEKFVISNP
jgi:hypothetical protein